MGIVTNWTCPKCGTNNVTIHDLSKSTDRQIETCDTEIGGCDEMFVVETERRVEAMKVYSLIAEATK